MEIQSVYIETSGSCEECEMGFENLWEKYGDKKKEKLVREDLSDETELKIELVKTPKGNMQQEPMNPKPVKKYESTKEKPAPAVKKEEPKVKSRTPVGVFGNENDISIEENTPRIHRRMINFNFSALRNLPWIDIIFVTTTLFMVISVVFNFEKVTTAVFNMLFPLLCNTVVLLIVAGLIIAFIWWITRNFRRPRRRW